MTAENPPNDSNISPDSKQPELNQPELADAENSANEKLATSMLANVNPPPVRKRSGSHPFRWSRLALKELRETLRDKRTIVTLILMPLLVYPALSLVFKTFLLSNVGLLGDGEPVRLNIAYVGKGDVQQVEARIGQMVGGVSMLEAKEKQKAESEPAVATTDSDKKTGSDVDSPLPLVSNQLFADFNKHGWKKLDDELGVGLREFIEQENADIGIEVDVRDSEPWELGDFKIIARSSGLSVSAADYFSNKLKQLNELGIRERLRRANLPMSDAIGIEIETVGKPSENSGGLPLASLIPLILVLMTITGAVYPAIDLTAGERERGTLETLMAAPVPRFGILFSKFVAVLSVAMMTAMLNLIGMFATIWAFQLDKHFGGAVFNLWTLFQVFLLLILFAAFFSSLLLAVTSFAKSFKEAQVYLIPIILLSLGPGLIAMNPEMKLDGVNSVTPMVNVILLARDVLNNQVEVVPAIFAVISTLLYAYLALLLAARIFGSDSILYAGQGSFAEMLQRPVHQTRVVPLMATIFGLVMLFPLNFASIGFIGRMEGTGASAVQLRFMVMALFTFLAFMVFPWLIAKHQNSDIKTAFGLNFPRPIFLLAGLLLGISLWPIMMYLITVWHDGYGLIVGEDARDAWSERLVEATKGQVERVRQVSPVVIAVCLSIVPAICEEWFFRGMLLKSLLKNGKVWKSILISAALFGAFHTLSNSVIAVDRLIPTALIGIMLGYLAYKSNSIIPGIILHALNNAFVVFLAYYQPRFSELSWFPGEDDPVPMSWVGAGFVVALIGTGLIMVARKQNDIAESDRLVGEPDPVI
jgi:membrane protease YdiL (CAAX protease family)/ABC-type Na+ efflux pump permease subunit